MDFSGRIRALVEAYSLAEEQRSVMAGMVAAVQGRRVDWTYEAGCESKGVWERPIYAMLKMAYMIRLGDGGLSRYVAQLEIDGAPRLIESKEVSIMAVWSCWDLMLAERLLGTPARATAEELWDKVLCRQSKAGHLQPLGVETSLDDFVYGEMIALHAAFNAALLLGDPRKMEQVGRAARWHVENTQPDHTTSEPWAMAAFAALDETETFAEQQLHDAITQMGARVRGGGGDVPLAMGLLADAVMTMESSEYRMLAK